MLCDFLDGLEPELRHVLHRSATQFQDQSLQLDAFVLVGLDDGLGLIGIGLPGAVATGSLIGLAFAQTVRYLAPALQTVEAGIEQVPHEMTEQLVALARGRDRWSPRFIFRLQERVC